MRKLAWLLDARPWMLVILIQLSSVHNYFIASRIHYPALTVILVGMILLIAFYAYFHNPFIQRLSYRLLSSTALLVSLLVIIWMIGFIIYPIKEGLNQHGSGDDAMQQPILAMMRGEWPYDIKMFDGAPISPGLGWLLLNAPFTIFNAASLFNPFYLGLMSILFIIFRKRRDTASAVLLSILACFTCIEQIYSYQDLLAIGCAFVIIFLLGEYYASNLPAVLGIGILSGFIATARVVFVFIPGLLALLWFKRQKQRAVLIGISGTLVASGFHLIGYLYSEFYQPLHLIQRGFRIPSILIWGGVAAVGVATYLILRLPKDSFQSRLGWFAAVLVIFLLFILSGELIGVDFNLRYWEAAHYLLPAIPAGLYAILGTQRPPPGLSKTMPGYPTERTSPGG
jgi:hypothetical protein